MTPVVYSLQSPAHRENPIQKHYSDIERALKLHSVAYVSGMILADRSFVESNSQNQWDEWTQQRVLELLDKTSLINLTGMDLLNKIDQIVFQLKALELSEITHIPLDPASIIIEYMR